jgi:hypothetical protein
VPLPLGPTCSRPELNIILPLKSPSVQSISWAAGSVTNPVLMAMNTHGNRLHSPCKMQKGEAELHLSAYQLLMICSCRLGFVALLVYDSQLVYDSDGRLLAKTNLEESGNPPENI